MKITRAWAMPNHNTFSIKPINNLVGKYLMMGNNWLDPFSRNSPFGDFTVTNDLSPDFKADYHLESLDFLKLFEDSPQDKYQSVIEGLGEMFTCKIHNQVFILNVKRR